MSSLTLVSHNLCPYVQRAAIALSEKGVPFERDYVDLSDKPEWFTKLSPLGKVPLLKVEADGVGHVIFESAVILEYLEEIAPNPLHPASPLDRAQHRSWIEFGSVILNRIAGFYSAKTDAMLSEEAERIRGMFARVEAVLSEGPWFSGNSFSLVDAVYGPIFRYFDTFDRIGDFGILRDYEAVCSWREGLAHRVSVRDAVAPDYPDRLMEFLVRRGSALSARIT